MSKSSSNSTQQDSPAPPASAAAALGSMANPAPLGLFGFAVTTLVMSCYNAGIFGVRATDPINAVVGLAAFYGGTAQAVAGLLEFPYGDTFSATAFTSYGCFWISFACFLLPSFGVDSAYHSDAVALSHAKAVYLLGWTLFTFVMLVGSARTSRALFLLFCAVAATFVLLTSGEFAASVRIHRAGGFMGLFTGVLALYNALAELLEAQPKPLLRLPLGKFVDRPPAPPAAPLPARVSPHHAAADLEAQERIHATTVAVNNNGK